MLKQNIPANLIMLTCFTFLCTGHMTATAATSEKPNIIFVLYDDLGYGQPTCYRDTSEFKTPNIDRLAKEGMRFTDAHSASSVCTPTRYGVLTGRYPSRIGQYGVLTTFSSPIIPKTRLSVASLLKQHGYETACIGKWHLGMDWGNIPTGKESSIPVGTRLMSSPTSVGFDTFYGYTHARNFGMLIEQDQVESNVEEVETQPRLAKKVVAFLDDPKRKNKPFFLYLPLCPPHTPIVPASEFAGKSGLAGKDGPYGDWLYQGDWVLGQVLQALDRQRLAENTLIIVSSDNGASGRSYAPLRGCKTSIYEGGHRVPFLARWPGKIKAGSVCNNTICLNDLMSTCAEIIGTKIPDHAGEDSFSILPDLLGTAKGPVREAIIHQDYKSTLAIRQGPWKLIFFKDGNRELYNLENDLSETNDISGLNAEIVDRLTVLMNRTIADGRSTLGAPQKNDAEISLIRASTGDKGDKQKKEGKGKTGKKGKKERNNAQEEETLAQEPNSD
jgi:arylsulfatase A-like enzyme